MASRYSIQVTDTYDSANPVTAKVELIVTTRNNTDTNSSMGYAEDGNDFSIKHIPGPRLKNLLLLRNATFIFFCMTMGYFRKTSVEVIFCNNMESFLKRNKWYLERRKREIKYGCT